MGVEIIIGYIGLGILLVMMVLRVIEALKQ